MPSISRTRTSTFLVLSGIIALSFLAIAHQSEIGDEGYHTERIRNFASGNWDLATPSTFPGYHVAMALAIYVSGQDSLIFLRLMNLLFGALTILVFHAAHRAIRSGASSARTVQYAFNAIIFPFFFLTYTDTFSLLLILCAVWMFLRQRYVLCALAAGAATTVRQNNILWLGLLFLVLLWEQRSVLMPFLPAKPVARNAKRTWSALSAACIFSTICVVFAAFMVLNGGGALGDKEAHPFPSFHTGNIFFLLFTAFFLFLPFHIARIPSIVHAIPRSRAILPSMILALFFYLLTFKNDHGYNQWTDWAFIRNPILVYFNASVGRKLAFFIPVALTLFSLWRTRLSRGWFALLYPMSFVFLSLSWLVEPRYFFIPLALFTLFREEDAPQRERLYACYACVTALAIFCFIARRTFFL